MKKHLEQLIANFCAGVQFPEPEKIISGTAFQIDNVTFALCYDSGVPDAMLVYADFGPVPALNKKLIYYSLLEENFITAIGSPGSFGLSSVTGNIVYTEQVALEGMTPQKLHEKFTSLSTDAKTWRTRNLVDDPPPPRTRDSLNLHAKV